MKVKLPSGFSNWPFWRSLIALIELNRQFMKVSANAASFKGLCQDCKVGVHFLALKHVGDQWPVVSLWGAAIQGTSGLLSHPLLVQKDSKELIYSLFICLCCDHNVHFLRELLSSPYLSQKPGLWFLFLGSPLTLLVTSENVWMQMMIAWLWDATMVINESQKSCLRSNYEDVVKFFSN